MSSSDHIFDEQLHRADLLLRTHRFRDAYEVAKPLLDRDPEHVPLLRVVGYSLLGQQKSSEARKYFETAQQFDADSWRAALSIAATYAAENNDVQVAQIYRDVLNLPLKTPNDHHRKIQVLSRLAELPKLQKAIKTALRCFPIDQAYTVDWLQMARTHGLFDEHCKRRASDYAKLFVDDISVQHLFVEVMFDRGEVSEAQGYIEFLLERFGRRPKLLQFKAKALMLGAKIAEDEPISIERIKEEAIEIYQERLQKDFKNKESYFEISRLLRDLESGDDTRAFPISPTKTAALDFLVAALTLDGSHLGTQLRMLDMLHRMKLYHLASPRIQKVLSDHPLNPDVRALAARHFIAKGEFERAQQHIDAGIEINSAHIGCLVLKAEQLVAFGHLRGAERICREELHSRRSESIFVRQTSSVEFELGLVDRAMGRLEPLLEGNQPEKWAIEHAEGISRYSRTPRFETHGAKVAACIVGSDRKLIKRTKSSLQALNIKPKSIYCVDEEKLLSSARMFKGSNWLLAIRAGVELKADAIEQMLLSTSLTRGVFCSSVPNTDFDNSRDELANTEPLVFCQTPDLLALAPLACGELFQTLRRVLNVQYLPGIIESSSQVTEKVVCPESTKNVAVLFGSSSAKNQSDAQDYQQHNFDVAEVNDLSPRELRAAVLNCRATLVHFNNFEIEQIEALADLSCNIICDFRNLESIEDVESHASGEQLRKLLGRIGSVINCRAEIVRWVEKETGVFLPVEQSLENALAFDKERVLIGIGAGLGNVLQTTPMIRAVSEFLNAPVDVYIFSPVPSTATLLANAPWINIVYNSFETIESKFYQRAFLAASASHRIPPLNCQNITVQRRRWQMMEYCQKMHEAQFNFLGLEEAFPGIEPKADAYKQYFVADLKHQPSGQGVVGIADGKKDGIWAQRDWPYFSKLSEALQRRGNEVQSFGMPEQYVEGAVNKTGTTLRETIENISLCSSFIASDSGLYHVAEALGVPTVVMFGPTSVIKNGPITDHTRLVHRKMSCSPCQWKVDFHRCKQPQCMTDISVEQVVGALEELEKPASGNENTLEVLDVRSHEAAEANNPYRDIYSQQYLDETFDNYINLAEFWYRACLGNIRLFRFEHAREILSRGTEKFPDDVRFRRAEAELLFAEKDFSACEMYCRKMLTEADDELWHRLMLMRVLAKELRWDEVLEFGNKQPIDHPEVGWIVGYAYRELGDWQSAKRTWECCLELSPNAEKFESAISSLSDKTYRFAGPRIPIDSPSRLKVGLLMDSQRFVPNALSSYRGQFSFYRYDTQDLEQLRGDLGSLNCVWTRLDRESLETVMPHFSIDERSKFIIDRPPKNFNEIGLDGVQALVGSGGIAKDTAKWVKKNLTYRIPIAQPKARIVLFAHHHLARWSPHGGEISSRMIVDYLQEIGYEILVVVANSKNQEVFCEEHEGLKYVVASQYRFEETARNVLDYYQPDLALTWGPQSLVSGPVCAEYNVPYILFVRYWKVVCDPPYDGNLLEEDFSQEDLAKYAPMYRHAARVITNARYVSDVVEKRFGVPSEVAYVPVWPPDEDYQPTPVSKRRFVTLINPRKAGGEQIVFEMAKRMPNTPFQLIGEPSIPMPGNVRILPYSTKRYWEMLEDTRVLLFPFGEDPCGTGRVVFEAFYCGIPCVAVDRGGLGEAVPREWLVSDNDAIDEWVDITTRVYYDEDPGIIERLQQRMEPFHPSVGLKLVEDNVKELRSAKSELLKRVGE